MTTRLLDAEDALAKDDGTEHADGERVKNAYEKLKDSVFGRLFSEYVLKEDASGDLLTVKAALHLIEAWSALAFFNKSKKWYSFRTPHPLDYQNLVHLIHPEIKLHNIMRGPEEELRRRDGFKLTDDRGTMRDALYEIDYCMICHEREKDACRTGLHCAPLVHEQLGTAKIGGSVRIGRSASRRRAARSMSASQRCTCSRNRATRSVLWP